MTSILVQIAIVVATIAALMVLRLFKRTITPDGWESGAIAGVGVGAIMIYREGVLCGVGIAAIGFLIDWLWLALEDNPGPTFSPFEYLWRKIKARVLRRPIERDDDLSLLR